MFDLALDPKGDLVFFQNRKKTIPMKIVFTVSEGKAIKLRFQIEGCKPLAGSGIKLSFDLENFPENKKALLLENYDAMIQNIKIRIQTSLGDISGRPEIGSSLELVKHKKLHDESTKNKVMVIIKEAISDLLPDAEVRVTPVVQKSSSGYYQKLVIYIYDNNMLIFKYDLKG